LNGLNQMFVYANYVDLIGDDRDALQSNTEVLQVNLSMPQTAFATKLIRGVGYIRESQESMM